MKSILQSIHPQYCELIASGKKTIEVRKTKPKIPTPFKVYIYQTKYSWICNIYSKIADWQGKVIGEYVCYRIDTYDDDTIHSFSYADYCSWNDFELNRSCIHPEDFESYANGKWLYGWHISDLKIYDNPKELSEFYVVDNEAVKQCKYRNKCYINPYLTNGGWLNGTYSCSYNGEHEFCTKCKVKPLTRPPQSWCYVEEV